jgi:hypothetical protein
LKHKGSLTDYSDLVEAAYIKGGYTSSEQILDFAEAERMSYNFQKRLENVFTYPERFDKESLAVEFRRAHEITHIRRIRKIKQKSPNIEKLQTMLTSEDWEGILDLVNSLVSCLENDILPEFINRLVIATEDIQHIDGDIYLNNLLSTLNAHFKDIIVNYTVGRKIDAIKQANRCKEIIELAIQIKKTRDREGLEPISTSQIEKVDEIEGRSIYRLK